MKDRSDYTCNNYHCNKFVNIYAHFVYTDLMHGVTLLFFFNLIAYYTKVHIGVRLKFCFTVLSKIFHTFFVIRCLCSQIVTCYYFNLLSDFHLIIKISTIFWLIKIVSHILFIKISCFVLNLPHAFL